MNNNCQTCNYMKYNTDNHGFHCYMFETEPVVCVKHSDNPRPSAKTAMAITIAVAAEIACGEWKTE